MWQTEKIDGLLLKLINIIYIVIETTRIMTRLFGIMLDYGQATHHEKYIVQ